MIIVKILKENPTVKAGENENGPTRPTNHAA
jgi:hypothetical protein